jgi:glycosyltransferase involved in cell wall biosynthesis
MQGQEYTTCGEPRRTIGIDCRFAKTHSGIGRYTRELVSHLLQRNDPWHYVLFVRDAHDHGLFLPENPANFELSVFKYPYYSLTEQIHFHRLIKKMNVDLMHFPHFNVPLHCPVPFVVTIHDLILHYYPNEAGILKRLAYTKLMKHAIRHAAHIITVSNFTADDIVKHYGESVRAKITVTYEGVSDQFRPSNEEQKMSIREKYDLPSGFILYVGSCKEHKNVQTMIDAVSHNQRLVLVIEGKEVTRLTLKPNVRVLTNIPDDGIPILMSTASLYIQPSLYEGFGLPVLEAMACGTRVVSANRTSLPEICGDHAVLVEPSVEGISKGITQALENLSNPETMSYAQSFSWREMTKSTIACYRDILGIFSNRRQ